MTGHVGFMNLPTGVTATGHQRVSWDKDSSSFVVKGNTGFKGLVANWFRKTFQSDTVKQENIATYKAIKSAYKTAHGDKPMPLAMRAALSSSRGAQITGNSLARMDQAETGTSSLHDKFKAIGVNTVPEKLVVHDNRKTLGEPKVLGRGAFNVVLKHQYNVRDTNNPSTHVFADKVLKPLRPPHPDEGFGWVSGKTGINRDVPRWADRNIAASAINDLLGTKSIPNSDYGVHQGEPCLVMDRAPGAEAGKVFRENPEALKNPEIQRLTNHLEVNIYLMGNGDNHQSNYLVKYDPVGGNHQVTGIDNDQSFGRHMTDPDEAPDVRTTLTHGYRHTGFPAVIDKPVFDKLMALDFDRDLKPKLESRLSPGEMVAAKMRLANAQTKATDLQKNGRVVADWVNWTQPDGAKAPGGDLFEATKSQDRIPQGRNGRDSRDREIVGAPLITVPRSMLMRDQESIERSRQRHEQELADPFGLLQ